MLRLLVKKTEEDYIIIMNNGEGWKTQAVRLVDGGCIGWAWSGPEEDGPSLMEKRTG